jgi:hypothetical protein
MVDESREIQEGPSKLLLLGVAATLVALAVVLGLQFEPSADALYCLAMVNDLLFGTTAFHWMSTPANYLVPDTLITLCRTH